MKNLKQIKNTEIKLDGAEKAILFIVSILTLFALLLAYNMYIGNDTKTGGNAKIEANSSEKKAIQEREDKKIDKAESKVIAEGLGSHYSFESCVSSSCTTASGEKLKNEDSVAVPVHWIKQGIVKFGDRLKVINQDNGKSVIVKVNDTGSFYSARYSKGGVHRIVDLNTYAFKKIADGGIIKVKVEKI